MSFFAHSGTDDFKSDWQLLRDHLRDTGSLAAEFAKPFGGERLAQLAGVLHDVGKYDPQFQRRLSGDPTRVDHSTAGAYLISEGALVPDGPADAFLARLVAYAIAGHHAGLADWAIQPGRPATGGELSDRLDDFDPGRLDGAWLSDLEGPGDIQIETAHLAPAMNLKDPDSTRHPFMLNMLTRMIFSCLVDADFKDTEEHYARLTGQTPDRQWPQLRDCIDGLIARLDAHMKAFSSGSHHPGVTPQQLQVRQDRSRIHSHARARATDATGLFTLTVPTGGGKTLTSLGFALDHARAHGKRRIIYAIPFTSIIDQTATQFRDILGDEVLLEHHSALEDQRAPANDQSQGRSKLGLAMEDWAAPIVVTTNVQLFESLFAARPSRCRKLHNIVGSVIVLDEAQALPLHLLGPCVRAIEELTVRYGCTVVLCTATQPALDQRYFTERPHSPLALPLAGRELAPDPDGLSERFRRVTLEFVGSRRDEELINELAATAQGLIIVNSRAHALELYRRAERAGLEGLIHLSTRQHADDRRCLLSQVRERLLEGSPCRVVATSLVEAGVDIDFPRLWRAEAGLEQIAQAAGRCNREGRRPIDESIVTIFTSPDHPPPRALAQQAADFARVLDVHGHDLLSPQAIADYFKESYWRLDQDVDREGILKLLRLDATGFMGDFRTVADRFRMIESGMLPVIIAGRDFDWLFDALDSGRVSAGAAARKLQTRLVQVPPKARAELIAAGDARIHNEAKFGDQFVVLVREKNMYNSEIGLIWETAGQRDLIV